MENRLLALITALSLAVGLVFGFLAGALSIANRATPVTAVVLLDQPAQDDFIIAVAEAYAGDHNLQLARDRLARLHSGNIAGRVEKVATLYGPLHGLISAQLVGLAVSLGSENTTLIALDLAAKPKFMAPKAAPAELVAANMNPLASRLTALQPTQAPLPAIAAPIAAADSLEDPPPQAPTVEPNPQPATPTRTPASNPKPNSAKQTATALSRVVSTVAVSLPDYVNAPALSIQLNARPSKCTSVSQLPPVVDQTIALCPNQEYPPFQVNGNNITIYGDPGGSAHIQAPSRAFGITVSGSNVTIAGVHIDADTDPADLNSWLCLYEDCRVKTWHVRGAFSYGGGILLDNTTNAAVISSTVSSGAIGVASVHGSNNKIVNNNLSNLNGWGAFLYFTDENAVVGNLLNNVTRSCMGPDGVTFTSGCESAGIAAIRAGSNLIVSNHCEHSSNCIYASGVSGYSSNNNKVFNNYCAASPHNCFEITFSSGNQLDYNVATSDPNTGDKCTYPFWISGSTMDMGPHNTWNCQNSAQQALTDSQRSTEVSTAAGGF